MTSRSSRSVRSSVRSSRSSPPSPATPLDAIGRIVAAGARRRRRCVAWPARACTRVSYRRQYGLSEYDVSSLPATLFQTSSNPAVLPTWLRRDASVVRQWSACRPLILGVLNQRLKRLLRADRWLGAVVDDVSRHELRMIGVDRDMRDDADNQLRVIARPDRCSCGRSSADHRVG